MKRRASERANERASESANPPSRRLLLGGPTFSRFAGRIDRIYARGEEWSGTIATGFSTRQHKYENDANAPLSRR